jgi:DNA-binding transcriptional regulator YdaS (Cro superfamily)
VAVVAESEAGIGDVGAGVKLNRWCAGSTAVCAIRSSGVDEWCDGEVSGKAVRQLSLWLDVLVVGGFADAAWL